MRDPDTAFRRKLSEYGLDPGGPMLFDRRIHHFPGRGKAEKSPRNKSAYYIGFEDRSGGVFGDYSQGLEKVVWQMKRDKPPTKEEREEWARQEAERAKRQAEVRARAAREVAAAWKAAVPANKHTIHPYLEQKHIDRGISGVRVLKAGTPGIRIMGEEYNIKEDILLIPMRKEKKLVNVQRIFGKTKRYWPSGEVIGTFCVVGGSHFKRNKTIYLCEGWATAWSIAECAKAVCLVAFNTGGLLPVAQRIRKKYGKTKLIIAADNDRWTSLSDDTPNPGVWYATKAAEEVNAKVAIPDFKDLSLKPTDFNDLHRMEGPRAVRKFLNPAVADNVLTVPQPGQEPDPQTDEYREEWTKDPPFRCLGVHKGVYYYIPSSFGEIVEIIAGQHAGKMQLCQLAPMGWWEQEFPGARGRGVTWDIAGETLMRECHQIGVYQPSRIRGRGFWRNEDGELIAHFGDRLLPPREKTFVKPESYSNGEGKIYVRLPRISGPSEKETMPVEESRILLDMFTSRTWDDEASGFLLAGWVALAPFSGALPWRPHIWLAGSSGSGKTTLIQRMMMPLLGGMGLYTEGATTEAGIRHALHADALPVIYDEAEQTTRQASSQIHGVLRLARSASSSGARIFKGTQTGRGVSYEVTSMFVLSSVAVGLREDADKSRVTVLSLKSPRQLNPFKRKKEWDSFQRELVRRFTVQAGRRLIARVTASMRSGRFDELQAVVKSAANIALGDARAAEQLGTLATGAWLMMSDDIPDEFEVVQWFTDLHIKSYLTDTDPEGHKILSKLLQEREAIRVRGDFRLMSVGELIDVAAAGPSAGEDPTNQSFITHKMATTTLRQLGFIVDGLPLEEQQLVVSIRSEWIERKLARTSFADGWWRILRTIPGATAGNPRRFAGSKGPRPRTTVIPFAALKGEDLP